MPLGVKHQRARFYKPLLIQLALVIPVAAVYLLVQGVTIAAAVMAGGFVACTNTLLQYWYLYRAEREAGDDPGKNARFLYRCAFERLVMTGALFAVAFGILKLAPLPMILGFIAGQVGAVVNGIRNQA